MRSSWKAGIAVYYSDDGRSDARFYSENTVESYAQPKSVVTSDRLLYKELGLRILDKHNPEEDNLVSDDYSTEESKTGTSTKAGQNVQTGYFFDQLAPQPNLELVKQEMANHYRSGDAAKRRRVEPANFKAKVKSRTLGSGPTLNMSSIRNPFNSPRTSIKYQAGDAREVIADAIALPKPVHPSPNSSSKRKPEMPHSTSQGTAPAPFASDSLSSFLELRGKRFKAPPVSRPSKVTEILDDPIQSTQNRVSERGNHSGSRPNSLNAQPAASEPDFLPPIDALGTPRTIVLNNSLLGSKPLLVQYLERQNASPLTLIYRDLHQQQSNGPDIILNPMTSLLITHLQALNQRPLPGHKTATGLSNVHDHIASLAGEYSKTIVLIHHLKVSDIALQQKQTSSMVCFTAFCQQLKETTSTTSSVVSTIWIPCTKPLSTSEAVNAWVLQMIQHHAYGINNASSGPSPTGIASAMIQDEWLGRSSWSKQAGIQHKESESVCYKVYCDVLLWLSGGPAT